jgi:hypothetical protein
MDDAKTGTHVDKYLQFGRKFDQFYKLGVQQETGEFAPPGNGIIRPDI